ncbi:cytochrome-c peroxidase [Rurimicrobium arvi]|uniref:Cytochrome c peroxidase n=1 Tax=Rurimicrobium arvi TaxID=2049916 RepID=A0ABP8MY13_9BACT
MSKTVFSTGVLLIALSIAFTACHPDPSLDPPETQAPLGFYTPEGWPQPIYSFSGNELSPEGISLGRKLFYDPVLSYDKTISCNSCHEQFSAFSHLDHPLSHGIYGLFGTRNAPSLSNLAWKPAFFWDGNVTKLEDQPMHPIENPVEMDLPVADAVSRLNADPGYRKDFKTVFGTDTISAQQLYKALSQFMVVIISATSRYDKHVRGEAGGTFTEQETRGLNAFRQKCASCHKEPLFTDYSYRNNGLSPSAAINDSGRALVTRNPDDLYKFMVPSLRNIDLSRPYMHDGRIRTLDAVLEHYRTGIVVSPTLDTSLTGGIAMTDDEKADIIAFLKTLSDKDMISDSRLSQPK